MAIGPKYSDQEGYSATARSRSRNQFIKPPTQPAREEFLAQQSRNQSFIDPAIAEQRAKDAVTQRGYDILNKAREGGVNSAPDALGSLSSLQKQNAPTKQDRINSGENFFNAAVGTGAVASTPIVYQGASEVANKMGSLPYNSVNPANVAEQSGQNRVKNRTDGYNNKTGKFLDTIKDMKAVPLEKQLAAAGRGADVYDIINNDPEVQRLKKEQALIKKSGGRATYGFGRENLKADNKINADKALQQNMADLDQARRERFEYLKKKLPDIVEGDYLNPDIDDSMGSKQKPTARPNQYNADGTRNTADFDTETGKPRPNEFMDDTRNKIADGMEKGADKVRPKPKSGGVKQGFQDLTRSVFGEALPKNAGSVKKLLKVARAGGPMAAIALSALDAYDGWQQYADEGLGMQMSGASKGLVEGLTFNAGEGIINSAVKTDEGKVGTDIAKKIGNIPAKVANQLGSWGNDIYNFATDGNKKATPYFPTMGTSEDGKGNQNGIEVGDTYFGQAFGLGTPSQPNVSPPVKTAEKTLNDTAPAPAPKQTVETQAAKSLDLKEPKPTRPMGQVAGQEAQETSAEGVSRYDFAPGSDANKEWGSAMFTNVGQDGQRYGPTSSQQELDPMAKWATDKYGPMAGKIPFASLFKEFNQEQDRITLAGGAQNKAQLAQQKQVQDMSMMAVNGEPDQQRMAVTSMIQEAQNGSEAHVKALANVFTQRIRSKTGADWFDPTTWFNQTSDQGMSRMQQDWKFAGKNGFTGQMLDLGNGVTMNYSELDDIEKELFNMFMTQSTAR